MVQAARMAMEVATAAQVATVVMRAATKVVVLDVVAVMVHVVVTAAVRHLQLGEVTVSHRDMVNPQNQQVEVVKEVMGVDMEADMKQVDMVVVMKVRDMEKNMKE